MNSSERREQAEAVAAAWIASRERDGWSEMDQARLEEWIGQSLDHRVAWLRLNAAWDQTRRLKAVNRAAGHMRGARHAVGTQGKQWTRALPVAAAGLLCLVVVGWFWSMRDRSYHTDIGAMTAVSLPDGSRVTLNTDTQIQTQLSGAIRHVQLLHGESYFQVAKDASRPFIVASDGSRIVAVGTEFGVRRDGKVVHVYVTEGKVRIEPDSEDSGRRAVQLVAGDQADILDNDVIVHSTSVDQVERLLSWRQGFLFFDKTTLADAVAEFNRYNRRKILIEDPSISAIRISGYFRTTNATGFAQLVGAEFPVSLNEDSDRIVIAAAIEVPR
jgi:transmembrane sensor